MTIYSHSRLSTFEQCRLRYKFRYIDHIPEKEKTIEAHLGSMVHAALEWLYTEAKEGRLPTLDEVMLYYSRNWLSNYKDFIIVKKDMTDKDYFNKGVQFLIDYYNSYKPFQENTLALEKEVFINLDEDGNYKLKGFIDRLCYNLETQEYEIHDYKTSNTLPDQDKLDGDRQLALYSIAVREMFSDAGNEKKVRLIWHYLNFNRRMESQRSEEQLKQLKQETLDLIRTIESLNLGEFTPTVSALCDWCSYKQICPAWNPGGSGRNPRFEKQMKLEF